MLLKGKIAFYNQNHRMVCFVDFKVGLNLALSCDIGY